MPALRIYHELRPSDNGVLELRPHRTINNLSARCKPDHHNGKSGRYFPGPLLK